MEPTVFSRQTFLTFLCLLLAPVASAQDLGDTEIAPRPSITVNAVTDGFQGGPADMILTPNDDMIIVWTSSNTVFARRLTAAGTLEPAGDVQISANTELTKNDPKVCVDDAGNPVITWRQRESAETFDRDIRYRRFDASFAPLTAEALANTFTTGSQRSPDIVCSANGDFKIVWGGESASDSSGIVGRQFASDGSSIGDEFQINTVTGNFSVSPGVHIASQDNDDFVVVWAENSQNLLVARRYSSDGVALDATPFEVSTGEYVYRIGLDQHGASGDFVVSWNDTTNFGQNIEARRFDSSGVPMGDTEFIDVAFTSFLSSSVAFSGPNGEVVVAFNPTNGQPYRAQRLDTEMQPIGADFVLTDGDGFPLSSGDFTLEGKANGELDLVYSASVPDQSSDIFAKRFAEALFADGFEAGDTSEWSETVP